MEINNPYSTRPAEESYLDLKGDMAKMLQMSYETVKETNASAHRLDELKAFCRKMGYRKIGIAFCKGLRPYGELIDEELSKDFEVYSACCNLRGLKRDAINVPKMTDNPDEVACDPLGQAEALNSKEVDIVVKCGFCLGHDILFSKHIKAPCTTIIVKDRMLRHKTVNIFDKSEK